MFIVEIKGEKITGDTHAELSEKYLKVCMARKWTASMLGEMIPVRDPSGKVICSVSFNGRIWPANPKGDHTDCLYTPPKGEGLKLARA